MQDEALVTIIHRNNFYKDGQRKLVAVLMFSIILNIILGFSFAYIITHPPEPKYFATTINGRITPLFPLSEPNLADSTVLQWANDAAVAAYTYNFVNYRSELQAASVFFTGDGWDQFQNALQGSNNLLAVKTKKMVVSAIATATPVILKKGLLNGVYSWRIQMPLLVTYQSASEFSQQTNIVNMLIIRVSTNNSPRGIGIQQFVVSPAGAQADS